MLTWVWCVDRSEHRSD